MLTEVHLRIGAILPMITGPLSTLASLTTIWIILRSHIGLKSCYHRLVLAYTILDFFISLALSFSTLPVPKGTGIPFAIGNKISCDVQGFVLILFMVPQMIYFCGLTGYFLLAIKMEVAEEKIRKYFEPFIYILGMAYGLFSAIFVMVHHGGFFTSGSSCWISPKPFMCDKIPGVPCTNGGDYKTIRMVLVGWPCFACFTITCLNMMIIFWSLATQEKPDHRRLSIGIAAFSPEHQHHDHHHHDAENNDNDAENNAAVHDVTMMNSSSNVVSSSKVLEHDDTVDRSFNTTACVEDDSFQLNTSNDGVIDENFQLNTSADGTNESFQLNTSAIATGDGGDDGDGGDGVIDESIANSLADNQSSSIMELYAASKKKKKSKKRKKQIRDGMVQALLYILAYFFSFGFTTMFLIIRTYFDKTIIALFFLNKAFHPIQGLLVFLIFIRPRVINAQKRHSSYNILQAFKTAILTRGEVHPPVRRRTLPRKLSTLVMRRNSLASTTDGAEKQTEEDTGDVSPSKKTRRRPSISFNLILTDEHVQSDDI